MVVYSVMYITYIYTCTKGTVCMCTMYSSVQCGAYTHTYKHVLKVQCVHVHQQCLVVHIYTLYKYIHALKMHVCTSVKYGSAQCDMYTHTYMS